MSKVICYPRCCIPEYFSDDCYYFEMFSVPQQKKNNVGHVGVQLFKELRKSNKFVLRFTHLALSLQSEIKIIRK